MVVNSMQLLQRFLSLESWNCKIMNYSKYEYQLLEDHIEVED